MTTSDNISAIEAIEKAADAILAKVPQGYGMTRDEALIYAETAFSAYPAILAEARKAEALKREIAEKDARIARLQGLIRDNGTPRFNAVCERAENAERENNELRAVMKECHAALKMMITPGDISGSTVASAFAAATSAECRARTLLNGGYDAQE